MVKKYIYSEKSDAIYFDVLKNGNTDTAIIFLHGLGGSRRSWGTLYNVLSSEASLYFVDLLGYGFSAKPKITYSLQTHIRALKTFIDSNVKEKHILIVGHSLGSIIALGYMSFYPTRIQKVILISLPYFHSAKEAYIHISTSNKYRFIFKYNLKSKILCTLMCSLFGSITRQISPLLMRDLPREVAQDVHRHSYQSYISSLTNILYNQNIPNLLHKRIRKKIQLIHGTNDQLAPIENIQELVKTYTLSLTIQQDADHRFPLFESEPVLKAIKKELA